MFVLVFCLFVCLYFFFAVLLNCFHPNPRVLFLFSGSSPHPTGGGGRESKCHSYQLGRAAAKLPQSFLASQAGETNGWDKDKADQSVLNYVS